jgi:hypothetical protein
VYFDGGFCAAEIGPRKQRKAQVVLRPGFETSGWAYSGGQL